MDGDRQPLRPGAEVADFRKIRQHHSRSHLQPARERRWEKKLGLSLYLDTRCLLYRLFLHTDGLYKRGRGLYELGRKALPGYQGPGATGYYVFHRWQPAVAGIYPG